MDLYKIKDVGWSHLEWLISVTEAVVVTERMNVLLIYETLFVAWNSHFTDGMIEIVLDESWQHWEWMWRSGECQSEIDVCKKKEISKI